MSKDLQNVRVDYTKQTLDEKQVEKHPIAQFENWFKDYKVINPSDFNAMVLSTVNEEQQPSSRIVLLKTYTEKGFEFYTNYNSHKGKDMGQNNKVSLLFFWPELERQVRIDGIAVKLEAKESDEYFVQRPVGSRIAAWASPQSEEIQSREVLEKKVKEYEGTLGEALERPMHWGGYRVEPTKVEFWQGRASRLHDRLLYKMQNDDWVITRLAP